MNLYSGNLVVFGLCAFFGAWVHLGIFDSAYTDAAERETKLISVPTPLDKLWSLLHILGLFLYLWRILSSYQLRKLGKITTLDVFFISTFVGLGALQLTCFYLKRQLLIKQEHFFYILDLRESQRNTLITRLTVLADWVTLPMQLWIVAWSNSVRRGWNPRRNFLLVTSSALFYLTIFHHTVYAFILLICGTLSTIALYELYKINFFRPGVKPVYYATLLSNTLFCLCKSSESFASHMGWVPVYFYLTFGVMLIIMTSRLFINISVDVNEHK